MATYTKPLRPYLFNCYYQWMVDNNPTKIFIQVNAGIPLVRIPKECSGFTQTDGTVVFNISPTAVKNFEVREDYSVRIFHMNSIMKNGLIIIRKLKKLIAVFLMKLRMLKQVKVRKS